MKVLLDANILLDVFLARPPWVADSAAVLAANRAGKIQAYVSAVTVANVFYVTRRHAGLPAAFLTVDQCLASFELLAVDRAILQAARSLNPSDYEDGIQIACAINAALDAIVTRDPKGFSNSPIAVFEPSGFLAKLASNP